ncbi:MAG: hypothetical protein WCF04_10400, partial [Candidatus Nanopelagicales bacterium]
MVPTDLVAAEVFARLVTPLMWTFLTEIPRRDDAWAVRLVARLVSGCGAHAPETRVLDVDRSHAPALVGRLSGAEVWVDDLLRDVQDRDLPIAAVPLLLARGDSVQLAPIDEVPLAEGDRILMAAGRRRDARRISRCPIRRPWRTWPRGRTCRPRGSGVLCGRRAGRAERGVPPRVQGAWPRPTSSIRRATLSQLHRPTTA